MSGPRPSRFRHTGDLARDRALAQLAVPALGALVAEPIYVLTDTAIVGQLGTAPLAGLALASAVLLTGYSIFIFLAYGTTASVSRLLGAGEHARAAHQAVQGLWLALGAGVALAALGWLVGGRLLGLLGAAGEVAANARIYLDVSLLGFPALLVSLAGVGYLRGLQDTRTPLVVALVTAVGNGVLEAVLIFGFGFGIGASALSTVLAQWVAAAVFVWRVVRSAQRLGVSMGPDPGAIRRLLVVGAHLLVRTAALRGSLLVGVAVAARIGTDELAAYEVGFQIWSLLALALDAIALAAQAMIGHALGAGDLDEARAVARRALVWGFTAGIVLCAGVVLARPALPALFSADPVVRTSIGFSLLAVAVMQPVNGAVFALDGILIGAGDQRFLAGAMTVAFAVFAPAALVVAATGAGLGWLWASIGLFMSARFAVLQVRFTRGRWLVAGASR